MGCDPARSCTKVDGGYSCTLPIHSDDEEDVLGQRVAEDEAKGCVQKYAANDVDVRDGCDVPMGSPDAVSERPAVVCDMGAQACTAKLFADPAKLCEQLRGTMRTQPALADASSSKQPADQK